MAHAGVYVYLGVRQVGVVMWLSIVVKDILIKISSLEKVVTATNGGAPKVGAAHVFCD